MASHSASTGVRSGRAHIADLVRSSIPPMHPAGRPIVAGALAGTLGLRFLLRTVGLRGAGAVVGRVGLTATAACALFFREPRRVSPTDSALVLAPANGLISLIDDAVPPAELNL